jgi:hypothetical protein
MYIFSEKNTVTGGIQNMITKPKINSIVAAQYSKDSFWYLAKIISIDNKSKQFNYH